MDNYGTQQSAEGRALVRAPPAVSRAFHPNECQLAQPSRALFLQDHHAAHWRGTCDSIRALEAAIEHYLTHHNELPKPFVWTATADAILDKIKRLCERTSGTRH
jgi:hypothetical protein